MNALTLRADELRTPDFQAIPQSSSQRPWLPALFRVVDALRAAGGGEAIITIQADATFGVAFVCRPAQEGGEA